MESAIPAHLETGRTRQPRFAEDYAPPYPSFVARHKPSVSRVVMAYFGLQYRGEASAAARSALDWVASALDEDGVGHWDRSTYVDQAGYINVLSTGYWDDPDAYDKWFAVHGANWTSDARANDGLGYFIEVVRPAVERYETLFSANDRQEGIAVLADAMSDVIQEHAYWGGARDRIPLSQTDDLAPSGTAKVIVDGPRRRILPQENLCLIRSGQDWSDTDAAERTMYFTDVEPVLRAGMDFLRDEGRPIGCISNRFLTVLDRDGNPTEHTFGMGWWTSLAALEQWSESHPTHVAIFGAAMTYLSTLGPAAQLKLYHEVTVAAADEQFFEYLNCHPGTGMLGVQG